MTEGLIIIILWSLVALYSALCLWIPNIRPYWGHTEIKCGFVSCLGMAMFVWLPPILIAIAQLAGDFWQRFVPLLYFVFGFVIITIIAGYASDVKHK